MKRMNDEVKKAWSAAEWFRATNNLEGCSDILGVLLAGCCMSIAMIKDEGETSPFDFRQSCIDALERAFDDCCIVDFVEGLLLNDSLPCNQDGKHGCLVFLDQLPFDEEKLCELILDVTSEWEYSKKQGKRDIEVEMTPPSLAALAARVLGVSEQDAVADLGCGSGSFLVYAAQRAGVKSVYGCDINGVAAVKAAVRSFALGEKAKVEQADMFDVEGSFDKCFSNYPLGYKDPQFKDEKVAALQNVLGEELPKFASLDWLFNLQLLAKTAKGGKAVGIVSPGATFNGVDADIRRYFVSRGWVEAVVTLPGRLFAHTSIPTMMIVLSHGNDRVRFVDAGEICQKGRRWNEFSDADIDRILELLGGCEADEAASVDVVKLLEDEDCTLDPHRYIGAPIVVENAVSLDSITNNITRGVMLSKSDLEAMSTDEPTPFKYLMLQNINDGEIDKSLPSLIKIEAAQEKYCLQDGDIVVSKMGPNFKVAMTSVASGEKILATSNLYIIRSDQSKVEPLYLKAFIESEQGVGQLQRTSVGSSIPSIPIKALKALQVALPSMERQREVAERYQKLQREITMYRAKIAEAKSKLARVIES